MSLFGKDYKTILITELSIGDLVADVGGNSLLTDVIELEDGRVILKFINLRDMKMFQMQCNKWNYLDKLDTANTHEE